MAFIHDLSGTDTITNGAAVVQPPPGGPVGTSHIRTSRAEFVDSSSNATLTNIDARFKTGTTNPWEASNTEVAPVVAP